MVPSMVDNMVELAAETSSKANVVDNIIELVAETFPKADMVDNIIELVAQTFPKADVVDNMVELVDTELKKRKSVTNGVALKRFVPSELTHKDSNGIFTQLRIRRNDGHPLKCTKPIQNDLINLLLRPHLDGYVENGLPPLYPCQLISD